MFNLNSAKKIGLKQNQMLKKKLKRWQWFANIGQFAKTIVKQNGRFKNEVLTLNWMTDPPAC